MTESALRLRRGAVAWQEVDGEAVVLDLEASTYLGTNEAGAALWSALAAGTTRAELIGRLQRDFGADRDQAERDVNTFIDICRHRGFLA